MAGFNRADLRTTGHEFHELDALQRYLLEKFQRFADCVESQIPDDAVVILERNDS